MSARYDGSDIPSQLQGWEVPPQVEPLLDYTGSKESGNRYDVLNGGGSFDPNGPHPLRKGEVGPNGQSSAAGRFQFIRGTWDSVAGAGTPMTEENQRRAAFKNAWLGYKQRTGRDLVSDMEEKGLTPEIAAVQDATWAGKPYSANDTLAQYGGSAPIRRESGNYQPSGGGAGDRWSEQNIPFQQQATKAGLLGMLGVNTTENERLALMKAGFRTMQTPGVLGKAIGAGGEAYVDTLMALNKQQAEIANMQTSAKGVEATGTKNRAEAEREKALAQKTEKETALLGAKGSLFGEQFPEVEQGKVKGYRAVGYDQKGQGSGEGKGAGFLDLSGLQTFTAPNGQQQSIANAGTNPMNYAPEVLQQLSDLGPISSKEHPMNDKLSPLLEDANYQKSLLGMVEPYGKDYLQKGQAKYALDKETYEDAARAARGNNMVNADQLRAVTQIPDKDWLASGKWADARYDWAAGYNYIAGLIGEKTRLDPSKWTNQQVARDELNKLNVIATAAERSGNEAAKVFYQRLGATPNVEQTKDVSNRIAATKVVMNKAAEDNLNVASLYGRATSQAGNNLTSVINRINPSMQYANDIDALTKMLNATNYQSTKKGTLGRNLVTDYIDGRISKEKFDEYGRAFGSANLSRYIDRMKESRQ